MFGLKPTPSARQSRRDEATCSVGQEETTSHEVVARRMLRARWALLFPGNLRDGQPLWAREGESLVSWKLNPRSRNHGPQPERDRPLRRGLQDRGQCGASRHAPDEPAQLRWLPSLYCVRPDSSGACVELASVICLGRCVERAVGDRPAIAWTVHGQEH